MTMRYERRWFTPALCRAEPGSLFVYGDNLLGRGKGGQAVIRDEPNAVGIPTKRAPSMAEGAFFLDKDFEPFRDAARPVFTRLREHLEAGGTVVWPADGIGTGLAQLPQRAPRIWNALERARLRLDASDRGGGDGA